MFHVVRFKQLLGVGQHALMEGYLDRGFEDRQVAVQLIEEHIRGFEKHGYNVQHDHWWCRREGDLENELFVVRPGEPKP